MPDMKSEPSPETYHMPSIWSGTLPYSPNSLPMVYRDISTHGSQTSSLVLNVLKRVALHGVLSSPLPVHAVVPQGSVLGLVPFLVFINDLSDSGNSSLSLC